MNTFAKACIAFNRSRLWQHEVKIGADRLRAPSLDRLIYLWRHKFFHANSAEIKFLRDSVGPGMHVVDVGANVGAYAHMFSHAVGKNGRVTAFEPDPFLFAAMDASVRKNGLVQLHPHRMALGDERGSGHLKQGVFNTGDNRLDASHRQPTENSVETSITTLDEFLDGAPVDFIKMDIQGWEMKALQGMTSTLRANSRLRLYIELWPYGLKAAGTSPAALLKFLTDHGFNFEIKPSHLRIGSLDFEALARREYWFADIYAYRP